MAKKKEKDNWNKYCPETRKVCLNKKEAAKKTHSVRRVFGNPMGYYKCKFCKSYHLYTRVRKYA